MLAAVGYRVGQSGVPAHQRRAILRSLVDRPYRKLPRVSGIRDWGAAKTEARMTKLVHCLASFAANARRRMNPPRSAIADWENDLEWLRTEYSGRFGICGVTS